MFIFALLAACAPATIQTARTNGQGNFQFGVEPGAIGAAAGGGVVVGPALNVAGRYGVSDRVDLGLRLGTSLYDFHVKIALSDPAMTDSVALALAPATSILFISVGGGGAGASVFSWTTRVPLLIGIPVGTSEFTLGPSLSPWIVGGGGSVSTGTIQGGGSAVGLVLLAGGTIGFSAHVADKFRVMPQFGLDVPVIGAAAASGGGTGTAGVSTVGGGVGFSIAVGLLFGGPDV